MESRRRTLPALRAFPWARAFPWFLRAAWVTLPLTAGAAYAAALHPHSDAVRLTATVVLWAGWLAVLVGTLVPAPLGLTALRLAAPAAVVAAVASAVTDRPSTVATRGGARRHPADPPPRDDAHGRPVLCQRPRLPE